MLAGKGEAGIALSPDGDFLGLGLFVGNSRRMFARRTIATGVDESLATSDGPFRNPAIGLFGRRVAVRDPFGSLRLFGYPAGTELRPLPASK